jgi:hypothetical protein
LSSRVELNFSWPFEAVVWNIRPVPQKELLIIELRNEAAREVRFSAFNYTSGTFLWEGLQMEESWWIGLLGATSGVVLLQTYDDTDNPGRKSLVAIDLLTGGKRWELRDFSVSHFNETHASGSRWPETENAVLVELASGKAVSKESAEELPAGEIFHPVYPFQYLEGNSYFETIRKFLQQNFEVTAVIGTEYLESDGLIFISYYVMEGSGLANYLLVMKEDGEQLLIEKLGEHLKGLGVETFFVLSGYLFFVKNKREILSYRIL